MRSTGGLILTGLAGLTGPAEQRLLQRSISCSQNSGADRGAILVTASPGSASIPAVALPASVAFFQSPSTSRFGETTRILQPQNRAIAAAPYSPARNSTHGWLGRLFKMSFIQSN